MKIGSTEHLKASDTIKQIVKIVDPDKKVRHLTKLFLEYASRPCWAAGDFRAARLRTDVLLRLRTSLRRAAERIVR